MVEELFILRGLPGSGKSTLIENLRDNGQIHIHDWLSTDRYWYRPDGTYDFNGKLLGKAHDATFGSFKWCFAEHNDNPPLQIVLDNTNTTYWELKRYVEYAVSKNPQIKIILLEPDTEWKFSPADCAKKNIHGVPEESIMRMLNRWEPSEKIAEAINNEFGVDVYVQIGEKKCT